jgi:glycosyltransferase involved in cell wall biosynthesis
LIPDFIKKWEEGFKTVVGVKTKSRENPLMFLIRRAYYKLIRSISEVEQIENYLGYGLYDQNIIKILRELKEPYPYLRGLICEIGFKRATIEYIQPRRRGGITSSNFYTLYDAAMLGITSNSKVPLRIATMLGFLLSGISLLIAFAYFIYKLVYWNQFNLGLAPLVIGLFFFSSVQLFFIGIIGEYIAAINTKVMNRPLVIEEKRINFDDK